MIEVIEPLVSIPGVRLAVLVSSDGVPVVARGRQPVEGESTSLEENTDALSGLAAGWLRGVTNSLAPLSWNEPERLVLRAARGTIVMSHAPGAVLMVLLEPGATADALRLPMQGTVARLHRMLRRPTGERPPATNQHPPAAPHSQAAPAQATEAPAPLSMPSIPVTPVPLEAPPSSPPANQLETLPPIPGVPDQTDKGLGTGPADTTQEPTPRQFPG